MTSAAGRAGRRRLLLPLSFPSKCWEVCKVSFGLLTETCESVNRVGGKHCCLFVYSLTIRVIRCFPPPPFFPGVRQKWFHLSFVFPFVITGRFRDQTQKESSYWQLGGLKCVLDIVACKSCFVSSSTQMFFLSVSQSSEGRPKVK